MRMTAGGQFSLRSQRSSGRIGAQDARDIDEALRLMHWLDAHGAQQAVPLPYEIIDSADAPWRDPR